MKLHKIYTPQTREDIEKFNKHIWIENIERLKQKYKPILFEDSLTFDKDQMVVYIPNTAGYNVIKEKYNKEVAYIFLLWYNKIDWWVIYTSIWSMKMWYIYKDWSLVRWNTRKDFFAAFNQRDNSWALLIRK